MNKSERIKMVKAMEFIARKVNDEDVFWPWLTLGVEDGAIEHGNLSERDDGNALDYYCEDENFSELMGLFLRIMERARKSGGLYCDEIIDDNNTEN